MGAAPSGLERSRAPGPSTASAGALLVPRRPPRAPSPSRSDRPLRFGSRVWRGIGRTWGGGGAVASAVGRRRCWGWSVVQTQRRSQRLSGHRATDAPTGWRRPSDVTYEDGRGKSDGSNYRHSSRKKRGSPHPRGHAQMTRPMAMAMTGDGCPAPAGLSADDLVHTHDHRAGPGRMTATLPVATTDGTRPAVSSGPVTSWHNHPPERSLTDGHSTKTPHAEAC
jgi:hypothetical protein